MSSYEVVERGSAAGIVITASHNPWVDNGFKVKAPTGAAAEQTSLASSSGGWPRMAASGSTRRPFADAEAAGLVERFDPYDGYERFVRRTVDLDALRDADMSILVDPMWGAGSGWLSRLLAGGRIRVDEIHQERNPYFGGVNPEPDPSEHRRGPRRCSGRRRDRPGMLPSDGTRTGRVAADERAVHPPAPGHRPADVLPGRAPAACASPVVGQHNNTSMAAAREHYGIPTTRRRRVQVHRPEDDRDRRDDGRRGVGRFGFGMHCPSATACRRPLLC
jgi:hypothetical protein